MSGRRSRTAAPMTYRSTRRSGSLEPHGVVEEVVHVLHISILLVASLYVGICTGLLSLSRHVLQLHFTGAL